MKSFSQNFEDVMLWRALSNIDKGFFIDIGAQHPVKDSVSKFFSIAGWSGIHVEPVPYYANMLRADRPNEQVIEAIVSDKKGLIDFYVIKETGLSTSVIDIAKIHKEKSFNYNSIIVPSISLDDVFLHCPDKDIHWLKIDVEGAEKSVLKSWKNSACKPWITVVEATSPGTNLENHMDWEFILINKGYKHVYSDGLNRFYLSPEQKQLERFFTYPPNIFDGFQLSHHSDHVIEIVRNHADELSVAEARLASLKDEMHSQAEHLVTDARQQLDLASKRENAIIRSAALQKQLWLKRRRQLWERLHNVQAECLAREHEIRVQSAQAIANERSQGRKKVEVLLEQIESANFDLDSANQRALSLESEIKIRDERLKSSIDEINLLKYNFSKEIEYRTETIRNFCISFEEMQNAINDILYIKNKNLLYYIMSFFKKNDIAAKKISSALAAVHAAHVVIAMKNDDSRSSLLRDPVGEQGGILSAAPPIPAMHQENGKLDNIDMPFLHGSTIIDLMSLPLDEFIETSYILLLGRKPERSELRIHGSALRTGLGRNKMLFEIHRSPECENFCANKIGAQSDDEFITWIYARYMNRTPDAVGLAHYTEMLARGVKREQIKRDIANSKEAKSTGGLWFELDRLMETERQKHKRHRRWLWRLRSLDRQQHQQQEVLLHLFHNTGERLRWSAPHQAGSIPDDMSAHSASTGGSSYIAQHTAQPTDPLADVDTSDMPPEARRIIVRLQHVKGASLEKGHA